VNVPPSGGDFQGIDTTTMLSLGMQHGCVPAEPASVARFITSLQLDQEPEETELAPCFLAYPTSLNAFAIPVRALESSIVAGSL
jgi:hypothetical protein